MKRRDFCLCLLAAATVPAAASARTVEEQIVSWLRSQGYSVVSMRRTMLGRIRVVAQGPGGRRELIVNPATGTVLRDYIQNGGVFGPSDDEPGGPSGDDDRDDDVDDDDDEDDDDDDDDGGDDDDDGDDDD